MRGLIFYGALVLCTCGRSFAGGDGIGGVFPAVRGWTLSPPPGDSVYSRDNLWDIIDGAAEVFLANGFEDLRIGEYTDARGTDVRVERYRHNSRASAFGIYSQERNPGYHFIDVGTQGYIEDQVLNFLCGNYYVKISSHVRGAQGREAMMLIARAIATGLNQEKGWPQPIAFFPETGKRRNAETYVAENFLGYRALHSAFVARYDAGYRLFLIECAGAENARLMADAYIAASGNPGNHAVDGTTIEVRDPHNGTVFLRLLDDRLLGILGSPDIETANRALGLLQQEIVRSSHK